MIYFATSRFPIIPLAEVKVNGEQPALPPNAGPVNPSDEALIARLGDNDVDAFALLFRRYKRVVFSICLRILRDDAEAEDLTQDVFLYIRRKCSNFDSSKNSGGSWIVHAAYQRAIERRRYLTTRHFYSREDIPDDTFPGRPTVEDDYSPEAVLGRNGLEKLFEALSEIQAETLRLYFFEGYTLAEISHKLGQPLGNVRHHYYRGLEKLRRQMFQNNVRAGGRHAK